MAMLRVLNVLYLLQCTLAVRMVVTADQDQNTSVGVRETGTSNVKQYEQKYYVFVKKVELGGNFVTLGLGWHTEIMFCPAPENGFLDGAVAGALEDVVLTNKGLVGNVEMSKLSPHFPQCITTGYAALTPVRQEFDDKKPYFFYGSYGDQELHYVGNRVLNVYDFIGNMQRCGNWQPRLYSLLYHNCNYFTKTVMTALGFPSPTFQVEKVLGGAWIPWQGYWDVLEGKCKGTKCTGSGYQDAKRQDPRAGKCDKGKCWDESEFNPETHTCSSQAGFSLTKWIQGVFTNEDSTNPIDEDKQFLMEQEWTSRADGDDVDTSIPDEY